MLWLEVHEPSPGPRSYKPPLGVFLDLRHFRFELEGWRFYLITDHLPLVSALFQVSPPWSACQHCQLTYISEFTCDVRHTPGAANVVADSLSRPLCHNLLLLYSVLVLMSSCLRCLRCLFPHYLRLFHTYLLTYVDRSTPWLEVVPLTGISTAECASAMFHGWISRFGVPSVVTSDWGRQFKSSLLSNIYSLLSINRISTTAFHPQWHGGEVPQIVKEFSTGSPCILQLVWMLTLGSSRFT